MIELVEYIMNLKRVIVIVLILVVQIMINAQNPGDSVFTGIQVHTIKLKFNQPNYWDSLTTYYNQSNEQYMVAAVVVDGVEIDSVGVRLKGNASYSHPNNKKSIRLSFDEYRDDQRWDGLKGVHLNNCWGDPSFLREKIHLDFCRDAGIIAPRSNYAMVYINDELWGLYSLVEHVDKKFLSSRFQNKKGNLYKAVDGFGVQGGPGGQAGPGGQGMPGSQNSQALSDFVWFGNADSLYYSRYEFKTDESDRPWTDVVLLINVIRNSSDVASDLPQYVNLPNFFKAIAADILFANMDSYTDSGRNFYFYFNPDNEKLEWIVWDVSLTFGGFPGSSTTAEQIGLTYTKSSSARPLIGKVFEINELRIQYLREFYEMFEAHFIPEKMFAHIDSVVNVIKSYVKTDPKKQYTYAQFETNVTSDITTTEGGQNGGPNGGRSTSERKPGIKSFITARKSNVQSLFDKLDIDFTDVEDNSVPTQYVLFQNYPNPFNPSTVITYVLPNDGYVILKVFDVLGNEIETLVDENQKTGIYSKQFNANLPSGVYFYKLSLQTNVGGKFEEVKKMVLLK